MQAVYQVKGAEGMAETITRSIRRILAPNPSPMTFTGTNTYLLGRTDIAVIDPGPDDPNHLVAILDAVGPGNKITKIIVTHSHIDHSPLAKALSQSCGAKIYAYGDSFAGRNPDMVALAELGNMGGGEGVDKGFEPDISLTDDAKFEHEGAQVNAIWTPGHFGNHMAFAWDNVLFCGDHVMGWASSMISPPDGDLGAFRRSCIRLLARPERLYLPGHGEPVSDGPARVRWLMEHRDAREAQIMAALTQQPDTAQGLAERIYTNVDSRLIPAATRNVLAHLIDLNTRQRVSAQGIIDLHTKYSAR